MVSSLMNNDEPYRQAPLNLIAGPDGVAPPGLEGGNPMDNDRNVAQFITLSTASQRDQSWSRSTSSPTDACSQVSQITRAIVRERTVRCSPSSSLRMSP